MLDARKSPLDEFDPNVPSAFGTYCPSRRPKWKLHARRQDAMMAVMGHGEGVIFTVADGKWVEVARFEFRQFLRTRCDICSRDLMQPKHVHSYGRQLLYGDSYVVLDVENVGKQRFKRDGRGRLVEPLTVEVVCPDCRQRG